VRVLRRCGDRNRAHKDKDEQTGGVSEGIPQGSTDGDEVSRSLVQPERSSVVSAYAPREWHTIAAKLAASLAAWLTTGNRNELLHSLQEVIRTLDA